MRQILYRNSFDGLLSAFHYALDNPNEKFCFESYANFADSLSLFDTIEIKEDAKSADKLMKRILAAGGGIAARRVLRTFLSEQEGLESPLFEYVQSCILDSRNPDGDISNPNIRFVVELSDRVASEIHRFKGLLRFKKLDGTTFYAPFEPDYNITVPVAMHFRARLRDQTWIIHDLRRDRAVRWNGGGSELRELDDSELAELKQMLACSGDDDPSEKFWKTYTTSVSISERKNPRLQARNMPRRYWKHLVEMKA